MQLKRLLWSRSLTDYRRMFDLTEQDLEKSILDYGAGPASFNAELSQQRKRVISLDPLFAYPPPAIQQEIEEEWQTTVKLCSEVPEYFVWKEYRNLEEFASAHGQALQSFLADFAQGQLQGRYLPLPIEQNLQRFDLALVSYGAITAEDASLSTVQDELQRLLKVADEVRVYPLLTLTGSVSPLLCPLMLHLQQQDFGVEVREVPAEFQKGGNAMLRVWSQHCRL